MAEIRRPVPDMDRREPRTSARAARTGGGVELTTILLPAADAEAFGDIDAAAAGVPFADSGGSGCIIWPRMEFPLPPNMPPFNVGLDDAALDAGVSDWCKARR